jgi:hypothetical protein
MHGKVAEKVAEKFSCQKRRDLIRTSDAIWRESVKLRRKGIKIGLFSLQLYPADITEYLCIENLSNLR